MAKFVMTSFQKKKHEKAFEFYAEVDAQGKHRTNSTIAGMVGASPSAVAFWKKRDNWDGKIVASMDAAIEEADLTNKAIKKLLRESLYGHIRSLNRVIEFSKNDADKVTAIKAFVHIAKELACLDPDTGGTDPNTAVLFKDDLQHAQQPTAKADELPEGAAGTDPSAGGASTAVGGSADLPGGTSGSDPIFALPVAALPDDDHLESNFRAIGL